MLLQRPHLIILLATFSGVSGIAYEVLYSRLLSTYFGDIFYISAAILASFLISIAIGSLIAHRYAKWLAYIELAIGAYALLAASVFSVYTQDLIQLTAFLAPSGPLGFIGVVVLLLAIPAFLIGFSIPICAVYVEQYWPRAAGAPGFRRVYAAYNIGAALAILGIEFLLLRTFGITTALVVAAMVNICVGIALLYLSPWVGIKKAQTHGAQPPRAAATALFLVSVASGIFQLFILKIANAIFGPLNENFAIILVSVFLGITLAAYSIERYTPHFRKYLLFGTVLVAGTFIFVTPLIYAWAFLQSAFALTLGISVWIKILLLLIFSIAGFTFFGGTIPLYLKWWPGDTSTAGKTLALASFGNATGFLLVMFVLHEYVPMYIGVSIAAVLIFIGALCCGRFDTARFQRSVTTLMLAIAVCASTLYWPNTLLAAGYTQLLSPERIHMLEERVASTTTFRSFTDSVSILQYTNGTEVMSHNGYLSMVFAPGNDINTMLETIAGASPALFSQPRDSKHALVLGLGTGITGGATAQIADTTRIVEINTAMPYAAAHFSDKNYGVLDSDTVSITIADGITDLATHGTTYEYIVNTVSSPTYYSASKLWTKEVLELMEERLTPGGIYSAWMDVRVGKAGMRSQMKTTADVFADCVYILLNQGYFNTICSNEPLTRNTSEMTDWPEPLKAQFAKHGITDITTFLTDLIIDPNPSLYANADIPLNTLDRPVLEFVIPMPYGYTDQDMSAFVGSFVNTDFKYTPYGEALSEAALKQKCKHLSVVMPQSAYIDQNIYRYFTYYQTCEARNNEI